MNQFKVLWSEEDGEWVGVCSGHPGLSHLAGTEEEALAGIRELVEFVEGGLLLDGLKFFDILPIRDVKQEERNETCSRKY